MACRIDIWAPIWDGKKEPKLGLAEYRMTHDIIEVRVQYTGKNGMKPFPHVYRISKAKAMAHPVQVVKGTRLRVIPIANFEEVHSNVGNTL